MNNMYFYIDQDGLQHGPIDIETLKHHNIKPTTKVWCEGMNGWESARNIYELQGLFSPAFNQAAGTPPPFFSNPSHADKKYVEPKPDSGLVWGILTTVLCCLPFGIVSIIYAGKVDNLWATGQYEEAKRMAKISKNWALAGAICGAVFAIIYAIYAIVVVGSLATGIATFGATRHLFL